MSKFDKVAGKKVMVRFLELAGKTGVWTTCSQAVKDYASKNFKSGDIVHIQYEDGENNMLHVSRIEAGAGEDVKKGASTGTPDTSGKPTCKDCGKELKDAKYEKCYTCNEKNPSKKPYGKKSYGKSPAEQESIKNQAIGKMTAQTLISMQGQVSPNNVVELIETVYNKYKAKVG